MYFTGIANNGVTFSPISVGTNFTYVGWIYTTSLTNSSNNYGNLFAEGGSFGLWYKHDVQKVTFYFGGDHFNNTALSLGKWHQIAVVNNGGNVTFYIDGKPDGGTTSAPAFNPGGMGCDNDGAANSECFNGKIDDVRVYNRALSATEVKQLYNLGTANVGHSNVAISNGLVGYWTFDGGSIHWNTNTVADMSGQGNTGQLVSMSTTTSPVIGKIGQALSFNGNSNEVSMGPVLHLTSPYYIQRVVLPHQRQRAGAHHHGQIH